MFKNLKLTVKPWIWFLWYFACFRFVRSVHYRRDTLNPSAHPNAPTQASTWTMKRFERILRQFFQVVVTWLVFKNLLILCAPDSSFRISLQLVGIWYVQYSIPRFFELDMKCSFMNVSELGDYHLHYDKIEFHNNTNEPRETIGTIEYFDGGLTTFFYTERKSFCFVCFNIKFNFYFSRVAVRLLHRSFDTR